MKPGRIPIVGIGASAGGLEAFQLLLNKLPLDTGMAFVLIQHLDPTHESALVDILSKATAMPVQQAADGMKIGRNRVYIIPSSSDLTIDKGKLCLSPRAMTRGQHMPINTFLNSLAASERENAIGVILSGSGSDGAIGIQSIKSEGGLTFAQSAKSAKYDQMPREAYATACVDFILTPEEIANGLVKLAHHPYLDSQETPVSATAPESALGEILSLLKAHTNVDFSLYKENTIRRRVLKRMVHSNSETLEKYAKYLSNNKTEAAALFNDILINVTSFFRDEECFDAITNKVFPRLLKEHKEGPLRIWVAGCSTGEEVYSIAIALLEAIEETGSTRSFQIFATDISERAIECARAGIYPQSSLDLMSPTRKRRFFSKVDPGYQISKNIRDRCIFAVQNVTADPPFSRIDVVSCRNLLIYLGPELQKKVLPIFHYSLKDDAYLVLGSSETIGTFSDLFEPIDKKNKIYKKKLSAARSQFEFPRKFSGTGEAIRLDAKATSASIELNIRLDAERYLLNHYAPVGVVIKENSEIIHTLGDLGPYLTLNQGAPSLNIGRMARDGLALEVRTCIQKAVKDGTPVKSEITRIKYHQEFKHVVIEVVPLRRSESGARNLLVLFKDVVPVKSVKKGKPGPVTSTGKILQRELLQTKESLYSLKENLQSSLERQEAVNEELKSANEEAMSSNEELQSTNEELETAKEELQSTNEELTTVNDELKDRNSELNITNNDLANLLTSVKLPVVMLGADLRIRRFTPSAESILSIIPTDIGRPITDISLKVKIPDLGTLLKQVMTTLEPIGLEVQNEHGHWFRFCIHPYLTSENVSGGTVLTLVDIHELKVSRDLAESIINTVREPLLALDQNLRVTTANRSFYENYKVTKEETTGRLIYDIGNRQWDFPKLRELLTDLLPNNATFNDYEVVHDFPGGKRTMLLNARRVILEADGQKEMILLAIEDVTERRNAENVIKAALKEKEILIKEIHHRVKNNLNIVSSLLDMQADCIEDKRAIDAFKDSQNRIRSIALIHEKLYQSADLASINFREYVRDLVLAVFTTFGTDRLRIDAKFDIADVQLSVDVAMPCSLIINELVSNSLKHAFPNNCPGEISVKLKMMAENKLELTIGDNGKGFARKTPFEQIKSLGLQLVETLVQQLEGTIENLPGPGTNYRITF